MPLFGSIRNMAGFNAGGGLAAVLKVIANNFGLLEPSVTDSGAADYVLALNDRIVTRSRATAQTLTVPLNATVAIPIGTQVHGIQTGAGALTVQAAGGVTINRRAFFTAVAAGQFSAFTLRKVAANVWNLSGDLTAA